MTGPLNAFPWVLNGLVEAMVSIRRLEKFFGLPEFNSELYFTKMYDIKGVKPSDDNDIVLKDCEFTYQSTLENSVASNGTQQGQQFILNNISFSVKSGELVGVIGPVGSGKSTLLEALLGEIQKTDGQISVNRPCRGVGYVKQEPWLQQGTVRDNIMWGKAYQYNWYNKVVEACALREDFELLACGDLTQAE